MTELHKRIVIGVEIETYSIDASDFQIGRRLSRPRPGLSESGERFARDASIGSEYNSRPFSTVRESLFLLKAGLRKYLRGLYRGEHARRAHPIPLLVGGWTNRFAGTHLHLSVAERELDLKTARAMSWRLHAHIPFLIAVCANSPIWNKRLSPYDSNRFMRGHEIYFRPVGRGRLTDKDNFELRFNPGRKTKPPTLEMRFMDSNLPEFVVAAACLVKAVCLRWLRGKPTVNRVRQDEALIARLDAATHGLRAEFPWNDDWLTAGEYLDRFVWEHRQELELMDVPDEVYDVLRLVKLGYNGARITREAAMTSIREHPQTWQRRFAKRYSQGLRELLSGNSLRDFAAKLELPLPDTDKVWLGRKNAPVDE